MPDPPVAGPEVFQGELVLSVSGERPVVDRKQGFASLAEVLVTDANQIWAEVAAKDGDPPERLQRGPLPASSAAAASCG